MTLAPETEPQPEPSQESILEAVRRHPSAELLFFPSGYGQYPTSACDARALLSEAGITVEYASNPHEVGVYSQKSIDVVLPYIVITLQGIATAGTFASTVDGLIFLFRHFLARKPEAIRIHAKIGVMRAHGKRVQIKSGSIDVQGDPDAAEKAIRAAIDGLRDL